MVTLVYTHSRSLNKWETVAVHISSLFIFSSMLLCYLFIAFSSTLLCFYSSWFLSARCLTSSKSLNLVLAFLIVSMEISWFSWELLSLLSHGIHLKMSTKILVYMQAKFFTMYTCSSNSSFLSENPEVLQQCQSFTFSELTFYVTIVAAFRNTKSFLYLPPVTCI